MITNPWWSRNLDFITDLIAILYRFHNRAPKQNLKVHFYRIYVVKYHIIYLNIQLYSLGYASASKFISGFSMTTQDFYKKLSLVNHGFGSDMNL